MTFEEMGKALDTFCDKYESCEHCPLKEASCDWDWDADNKEIVEMYNLAFPRGEEAKTITTTEDLVNHPSHYTNGGMECIDEMILIFGKEATANFCLCNAWKYRRRALYKNGEEDIQKSHWYINKYRELKGEAS